MDCLILHVHYVIVYLYPARDECAQGIDTCAQICIDTPTSYICSCNIGYYLRSDGRTCYGEETLASMVLC